MCELPEPNIGRFCESTISMRKPSFVIEMRIWSLNAFSAGVCSISAGELLLSAAAAAAASSGATAGAHHARRHRGSAGIFLPSPGRVSAMSRPPPCDHARTRRAAAFVAAEQARQRRVEVILDALLVELRRRTEQPHQQEERHHRGDEVGVGDLPCAAVMAAVIAALFRAAHDHAARAPIACGARDLLSAHVDPAARAIRPTSASWWRARRRRVP